MQVRERRVFFLFIVPLLDLNGRPSGVIEREIRSIFFHYLTLMTLVFYFSFENILKTLGKYIYM